MTNIAEIGDFFLPENDEDFNKTNSFTLKDIGRKIYKKRSEKYFAETLQHLENSEARFKAYIFNKPIKKKSKIQNKSVFLASAGAVSLASTKKGAFFASLKSSDTILRILGLILAVGSVSFPFFAYNYHFKGENILLVQNNAIKETELQTNTNLYKSVFFAPMMQVLSNLDIKNTLEKADTIRQENVENPQYLVGDAKLQETNIYESAQESVSPSKSENSFQDTSLTNKPFIVKYVLNGMALIEYRQGYWFASPGSRLPDGSIYLRTKFNPQTKNLELLTTGGNVLVHQKDN